MNTESSASGDKRKVSTKFNAGDADLLLVSKE